MLAMAAPAWNAPEWTTQVPKGVSFDDEIELLSSFARQAPRIGCRVVPAKELNFETQQFADLVIERKSDGARLMFGLSEKSAGDSSRIDILTRPQTGHAVLVLRDNRWRLSLGSTFLHPKLVESLRLKGLLTALLDERT